MNTAALLIAHGSADPRAAATTRAMARAVAAAQPGLDVRTAYLEHTSPRPGEALHSIAQLGHTHTAVVPLLLTHAYHARVDLPAVLATTPTGPATPHITDVLGPVGGVVPGRLLTGLRRRLHEATTDYDAVVLAAAGTRDTTARTTIDQAAHALGTELGVPCTAGYASASPPTAGQAVANLKAAGARRVAVAAYFLAIGQLYDVAAASALTAGAVAVAQPLGDAHEVTHLILDRMSAIPVH